MKPIPGKDFLSEEDLKKVLDGTADDRIKKLLQDCDLSKEAVEGYLAVPGAISALPSLKKDISASLDSVKGKSGLNSLSPMTQNILALCFAAIVVGIPAYFLWPREDDDTKGNLNRPIAQQFDPEKSAANVAPILTPQAEHFVNPEAKPVPKFSPVKANNDTTGAALKVPITASDPVDLDPPQLFDDPPVVPDHPDVTYNSSIGYIFDLKITAYENYRNKVVKVNDVPLHGGVQAQFDNADDQHDAGADLPTTKEVPLEQYLKEGLLAFREMRYGKCIEKMEVLLQNDSNDVNANFYIGICYVKLELQAKSFAYLDKVLAAKNNVFHEEADWYEALALIGEGDKDGAKKILTDISSANGFYADKAKDKLKELEK